MDTSNTSGMAKQLIIWGAIFIGTALIIAGMVFLTKRTENAAANRAKGAAMEYARTLNLNTEQFSNDIDSDEIKKKVSNTVTEALSIPITYTPTFFLNGTRIDAPRNYEAFKTLITQTLAGTPVTPSSDGEVKIPNVITDSDWVKGSRDAKVVLIEYSDFQCPACAAYFPMIEQLTKEFGDQMAFVYRHFPLVSIHEHAEMMARASEAAGKQGKFWEMYEIIFKNQTSWAR